MKRTMLSLTTAIALALPAVSHANVEATVIDVLQSNGYEAGAIEMLSDGQIAEIYVTATSEDATAVREVLSGIEFGDDDGMVMMTGIETTVTEALEANGYAPDMVNSLSSTDMAAIYDAYTSENATQTENAIASAIETNASVVTDDPTAAEQRAINYLAREGYSADQIDSVNSAELVAIYTALTSGDQNEINDAVTSALAS